MGDLNARHKELGSHLTTNANDVHWKAFLDTTDTAVLSGEHAPTHVQGGRLDYVALINMILAERPLRPGDDPPGAVRPGSAQEPLDGATIQDSGLVVHVVTWYTAVKSSFTDAEALYDGILHTIKGFITTPRVLARAHTPCRWTYAADPVILNCQQMLAAYQRRWQLNPADTESQDAMVTMARHLTDLRQQERKKYVLDLLPGQGAQDPVPSGGVAPCQQHPGQVQATGV
ncbi:hypothetical protein E2C01_054967 [Portunus trituberculatus]|uniref:Endonuclease/exonuclease/phosphatase domain-containing protein n=1 Tax=Portunus trituberculatus TaxID=210409 RepID=A0A5B7GUN8_PORTR|nr:hypothetical protein [Portunus trituberculatus]